MTAEVSTPGSLLVKFLQRGRPLLRLPIWQRYLITLVVVLVCFGIRYALGTAYPYPYLVFLLGVIFASFILDRGSGFFATFLSAVLAVYFFVEPRNSFVLDDIGQLISVILFVAVGMLAASIIEALRATVEELTVTTENLARSRLEFAENLNILETVIESTPDPVFVTDRESRYQRVNAAAARLIGAPVSALQGKRAADFLRKDLAEKLENTDRVVLDTRSPLTAEEQMSVAGEGPHWFLTTKAPWYGPDGSLLGIITIARDIHERKLVEEQVRAANAQKDLLLHDINHRVKNHLQSIISMLGMSRRQITDQKAQDTVAATIARLTVLARVYDRLQLKPGGEAVVSAREFIEGLCGDLKPALFDLRPISLELQVEHVPLDLSRAVSVGLIVNEAMTNALKYGFPDDMAGSVAISFAQEDGAFCLEVADTGTGMRKDQDGGGVGIKLIRALAQQLKGSVEWKGPPGTSVVVRFPDNV